MTLHAKRGTKRERKQKALEKTSWQLHLQFGPALQVKGLSALGPLAESTAGKESEKGYRKHDKAEAG
jgi:hypothetical protein